MDKFVYQITMPVPGKPGHRQNYVIAAPDPQAAIAKAAEISGNPAGTFPLTYAVQERLDAIV